MSVLRLENVKKTFEGGPEVLRGISLAVEEGEVVAIIGPSGGGKSTLLRCMIDLEEVTDGSIYVGEDAIVKDGKYCSKAERARLISEMGMVFQGFNLFPHMTVREAVPADKARRGRCRRKMHGPAGKSGPGGEKG
jgi:polar amino acid transport system ATP-binding protein